jgi:uracil-DNA glycosylase family 4
MTKSKQQQLDAIRDQILADDPTPELRTAATQLVFADGNADAELVFIGEAPGKNEDIQGKPFVGAAGRFLNDMLAMIGLKRQDIYITNIVKYRPPNNRDPLPPEKQVFLKYLESQLEVIQPALTVTLGRHSLNCFLPDLSIGACHGQPKRYHGRVFLPLFHPAAALYNGGLRQTLIDDFSSIPAILQKIKAA